MPRASSIRHSASVRLRGERFRRQSRPNIFAVTVVVVALGRSMCFLSFPAASSLVSAAANPTDQPPNPSTASTRILPSLGAVGEAASIELCLHLIRVRVEYRKKEILPAVPYLKIIIPKIYQYRTANPLRFGLRIQKLILIPLVT